MKDKFFSLEKESETEAKICIYGDIVSEKWLESDVTADNIRKELESFGDIQTINVHINSYGGSTFQALAIYNLLKQHKAFVKVFIDGIAASAASIIAMAGDKIFIPKTAFMMIHNCWSIVVGNAEELRKNADDMDKLAKAYKEAYMSKINISKERLEELLADETIMTAEECVEMGFADEILEYNKQVDVNSFADKLIFNLVNRLKEAEKKSEEQSNQQIQTLVVPEEREDSFNKKLEEINEKLDLLVGRETNKELNKDPWESFFNTKK